MHRYSNFDMARASTRELIDELRTTRHELEHERDRFIRPSLQNHIAALEHTLAIHNARSTARLDGMPEERLLELEQLDVGDVPFVATAIPIIRELVAEVRRLQGERAMLLPRFLPEAAEATDTSESSYDPDEDRSPDSSDPPDRDEHGNRLMSPEEVAAREHVDALDADAADEFERMLGEVDVEVRRVPRAEG